jgi:hypothetical protein
MRRGSSCDSLAFSRSPTWSIALDIQSFDSIQTRFYPACQVRDRNIKRDKGRVGGDRNVCLVVEGLRAVAGLGRARSVAKAGRKNKLMGNVV